MPKPDHKYAEQRHIENTAERWNMSPDGVHYVYILAQTHMYGKTRRILLSLGVSNVPSTRQIRYFVKTLKIIRRYGSEGANMRDIIRRQS